MATSVGPPHHARTLVPGESGDLVPVIVVERYDRRRNGTKVERIHQEDMCQSMNIPSNLKYENHGGPGVVDIMSLLTASETPFTDRYTFFKTQMLFWLMAAIDGHAKNFSVFLLSGGRYRLTPAYDVLSAHHLAAKGQIQAQKLKMAMAVSMRLKPNLR